MTDSEIVLHAVKKVNQTLADTAKTGQEALDEIRSFLGREEVVAAVDRMEETHSTIA